MLLNVLPNLSKLTLHTMPISAPKRKASEMTPGELYFKAYKSGPFRKLSNLFGPVEWKYQQAKFQKGSAVYDFLEDGLQKTLNGSFRLDEFAAVLKAMGHDGKLESYVDSDGALATGLIAQMTSLIARNPESPLALKRLTYIMKLPKKITQADALDWHGKHVNPALDDEKANELMQGLLVEKYAIPEYADLLRSTGTMELHEAKGRGKPNKWEWQMQLLTQEQEAAGFTRGGDVLGKLLMKVRSNILEAEERAAAEAMAGSDDDVDDLFGDEDSAYENDGAESAMIGPKPDAAAVV
jgi:hypothetical protein